MARPIGVFDSGRGGLSVVNAIKAAMPDRDIIFVNDQQNVPYGSKSVAELQSLVLPRLQELIDQNCEVIVIACNTVTTTIIQQLRDILPVPLIGMEPMVKPAASQTKSGVIAVCATPATLQSERYQWLKSTYAHDLTVIEPECSDWSYMIESNSVDHQKIRERIVEVCKSGADTIVLGCTHYHWIEQDIQSIADDYGAVVIQPEQAVVNQLRSVLDELSGSKAD